MSWDKYIETATSLTSVTRKRAEQIVKGMVKQGEVAAERAEKMVDDLLKRTEANRKAVAAIVKTETEKAIDRLGLVKEKDVNRLERKVTSLEKQVESGDGGAKASKTSSAAKRAKKSSTAKKATTSSPAKKAAKKTAAAKTASAAKKATHTGKKATGKKATAGRTTAAKKTAAKKTAQAAKQVAPSADTEPGGSSS